MRIFKTLLVVVLGPTLGALLGYFVGTLLVHAHAAHPRPVDRVIVDLCGGFGLVIGTTLSMGLMAVTLSRKDRKS